MNWTFCQRCGVIIPEGDPTCGHCHARQEPPGWSLLRWLQLALLVALVTVGVIVGLLALARATDGPSIPPAWSE
jgi:hypothetical protein